MFGSSNSAAPERRAAYLDAMGRHGLAPQVRSVAPNAAAAREEATRWLQEFGRPVARVVPNGLIPTGAGRAARAVNLALPRHLAPAGFGNEPWTELAGPALTVIEQPVAEIGTQAMRLLFEGIERPVQPAREVFLSGSHLARESTAVR
ncbi:substrate-binding domain-containing protein [Methylobacterium organophilum]|nr:substrate-binding domain-containing protein [Methylobacterium organophilum]